MRWNDSATGFAASHQMLTMPVATCSVVVPSRGRRTTDPDRPVTQGFDVFGLFRRDAASERSEPAKIGLARSSIDHGGSNLCGDAVYSVSSVCRSGSHQTP